ncbi:MAG: magnesium chelatase, partial [Gemmataceae bacterium]|nr:magnesium chelatase [Gemmataceae bacterium]
IDLVANLVEKSLVVVDPGGERYHFLETIREYEAERLGADTEGERAAAVELALEALYLAKKIDKNVEDGETVYG